MIASRFRSARWWIVAVALVATVAGATWPALRDWVWRPPHVVVIVLDSMRGDRVSARLTPFLRSLAAESTVYDRAYVPCSWTLPSVTSFMTGQYPSEHGVNSFEGSIRADTPTLANLLARRGYATSAVTANPALVQRKGFARGFERYTGVGEPTLVNPKADGRLVVEQALRWVDEVGPDRPHFLYLHFMDSHMPYRTHDGDGAGNATRRPDDQLGVNLVLGHWDFSAEEVARLVALYDGEVRYQDGVLRELFAGLERRHFLERAMVIVVADHGEEFGEHGVFGHGASLHEAVVHVPLLVRLPGGKADRVREPVQAAGLTATILAAAGMGRPPSVHIDPIPLPGDAPPATVFSELVQSGQKEHWLHARAVIAAREKLLVRPDGTHVSYDLAADPGERSPREPSERLELALVGHVAALWIAGRAPGQPLDPATRDRLRAVGYLRD